MNVSNMRLGSDDIKRSYFCYLVSGGWQTVSTWTWCLRHRLRLVDAILIFFVSRPLAAGRRGPPPTNQHPIQPSPSRICHLLLVRWTHLRSHHLGQSLRYYWTETVVADHTMPSGKYMLRVLLNLTSQSP